MDNLFFSQGRKRELTAMERSFNRPGFKFAVIYGRRRVGKTSLIAEFIREGNKKAIYYMATEQNDGANLKDFSEAVFELYPSGRAIADGFLTWDKAFEYIAAQAAGENIVVAIDEFPYLAGANKAISSILQRRIDLTLSKTNIMLILCGSSMSFMENQVLGYKSPLYGRRSEQYKITPLDYYDSAEFFAGAAVEQKLIGYAVTGGIPQYLNIIGRYKTVTEGIRESFFDKFGSLYEEPQNLLKQELREPAVYNTIIASIANGASKLNEIATKSGEDNSKCGKYIKGLISLGIIEKETPIGTAKGRNGVYRLKDNMYRFWYRFVPENLSNIESGKSEHVYDKKVAPFLPEYMGHIFEDVCKQYMIRQNANGSLPFVFDAIGRWWGNNPVLKREEEIDLVAVSKDAAIFGECKWRNEKAGVEILDDLKRKAVLFKAQNAYYYIFSKSGFSDALKASASKDGGISLIGLNDLFNS
ncbi:MAG: ATP-binding protein [Clostridiales bacterium]|nr:ATP-binding protein [Clostridiales bacterium]